MDGDKSGSGKRPRSNSPAAGSGTTPTLQETQGCTPPAAKLRRGGTFDELPEETQFPEMGTGSQFDAQFSSLTPSNGSLMEELTKPIMVESQDDY